MRVVLIVTIGLMAAGLLASLLLYWKLKKLLRGTAERVHGAATTFIEEVSSYTETTQ